MALGMDSSLPGTGRSALRAPAPAPRAPSVQPSRSSAPGFSMDAVDDAVNNQLAAGYGAREGALRSMDRAGVSRGKGHAYYANIAQEAADAQGQAMAARTLQGASDASARAQQAKDTLQRSEDLASQGLLENLRSAQAAERIARQGWGQDMYETWRRGQFGLDQMQLDVSPLLQRLFAGKG